MNWIVAAADLVLVVKTGSSGIAEIAAVVTGFDVVVAVVAAAVEEAADAVHVLQLHREGTF